MYDINEFYDRLSQLRSSKDISMRKMSLDLGQSESYIKEIEAKSNMPSMASFFNICDYLGIHPKEFFDDSITYPATTKKINEHMKNLTEEQLISLEVITRSMSK